MIRVCYLKSDVRIKMHYRTIVRLLTLFELILIVITPEEYVSLWISNALLSSALIFLSIIIPKDWT